VEFAGYFNHTPQQIRSMLGDNALTSPATHVGFETDADKWEEVVGRSAFIGHKWVVVPGIDQTNLKTIDDWKRVAASFNRAAEVCKQAELGFAYHNHQSEFVPIGGRTPYDVLLKECDPELVKLEMDLAWATVAGQDPVAYFTKYPGRFPLVHVMMCLRMWGAGASTGKGSSAPHRSTAPCTSSWNTTVRPNP
jgi:sugar phosphate isomerase/epimerase